MKSSSSGSGHPPSFKTIADAREFLWSVSAAPISEVRNLLLLQMFVPCPTAKLIEARYEDFYVDCNIWCNKKGVGFMSSGRISTDLAIPLSQYAVDFLTNMFRSAGSNGLLFPTLLGMKKSERTTFMNDEIQTLWRRYFIDPDGFRYFFAHTAAESGYFQPKFVKSVINGKPTNSSESYRLVSRTLVEWWGRELCTTTPPFT